MYVATQEPQTDFTYGGGGVSVVAIGVRSLDRCSSRGAPRKPWWWCVDAGGGVCGGCDGSYSRCLGLLRGSHGGGGEHCFWFRNTIRMAGVGWSGGQGDVFETVLL
ncbi:hypothetical protein R6Q59_034897 [Mikania micrantha]|uniref:Uncharacterized protein n=1 Tax=Mikania micrantha TaxID=192012 RepID=A0A5N6NFZ5_9ASTR|nr:hypothetical protein E3N88_20079 [Mikania micrantha]